MAVWGADKETNDVLDYKQTKWFKEAERKRLEAVTAKVKKVTNMDGEDPTTNVWKENRVDWWLTRCVEDAGGFITKMHPMSNSGIPDRIIIMHGKVFFVELKTTGEKCTPIQVEMHKTLKTHGIDTYVLDTKISNFYDLYKWCYTTYEGMYFKQNKI